MGSAVVQITLLGLLLALATALPNKDDWDIYSFYINSTVTSRYATTVITSRVANRMNESKEIEFHVRIPKNAFISKFKMRIDGQDYNGVVKAKEEAKQQYTHAVSRGQSAGIVSSVGRTLEEFKTSVTVAAHKKVTFELTYEELLKRRLGKYELQIHARPMQPVKDFKVDVHINENAGINFLEVKGGLITGVLANAVTKTYVDKQAWLYFYPTVDQQKTCQGCGDQGLNGDLVIVYDVNRNTSLGDIKTSDGYFVHHFAPYNLARIPKNVVFIIDQSGSMYGKKIEQTRIALIHILKDLAADDYFGLITFDSNIFHWKRELVQATEENLNSARAFARGIQDRGATDINAAVLEGARMLNSQPREGSASILILLTDGDPTTGVTNLEVIQSNVRKAIAKKFPLYCLGFGFDVNFEFLEKMSLQNNGVARRIYEDSDADLQLKGFYEEVATPLLTDVTMTYVGSTNLTQTTFSQYYNGSEIVVAGQLIDNNIETFIPQVVAISKNQRIVFSDPSGTKESTKMVSDNHIQRVWAYLTVKQLLDKELLLSGPEKDKVEKEALRLSLKYSFVTPLTSMVVTKPQGENTDVLHKPKEGEKPHRISAYARGGVGGYPGLAAAPPVMTHLGGYPGPADDVLYDDITQDDLIYDAPPAGAAPPVMTHHDVYYDAAPPVMTHPAPPVMTHHITQAAPPIMTHLGRHPGGTGRHPASRFPNFPVTRADTRLHYDQSATLTREAGLADVQDVQRLLPPATYMPVIHVVHRFLLKSVNLSRPLCFDITGAVSLKLIHHPNIELSVNGELNAVSLGGFKRILIHFKTDNHIEIDTTGITVRRGQTDSRHTGDDIDVTADSLTVMKRGKEFDVSVGDLRMVILIQVNASKEVLWPALRQKPSDTNITGILALEPVVYEEVQQIPSIKLQINNQKIDVTRSNVVDHSVVSQPTVDCWYTSAESALQRPLNDFIVTQL